MNCSGTTIGVLIFNLSSNVGFGTQKRPQALPQDPKSGLPLIRQPRQRTTRITSFLYQAPSKSLFVPLRRPQKPSWRQEKGWGVLRKNTVKEQYLLLPRKIVQFSNCLRKMIESSGKSYRWSCNTLFGISSKTFTSELFCDNMKVKQRGCSLIYAHRCSNVDYTEQKTK